MAQQYIDPYAMDLDVVNIDEKFVKTTVSSLKNAVASSCNTESVNLAENYYKRLVKMILNDVNFDKSEEIYKGQISVSLKTSEYDVLNGLINSYKLEKGDFTTIDSILSNSCKKTFSENISNFVISWQEYLYITVMSPTFYIFMAVLFLLYMGVKLYRYNFTTKAVVKIFLLSFFILDFLFTWMHLYQKEEVSRYVDSMKMANVPDQCNPDKITVLQSLWQFITNEDQCKKYHELYFNDIIWKVGPMKAFTKQFENICESLGKSVGFFTSGIMGNLPWGIGAILLPFVLFAVLIFSCVIISFITNTGFQINLFYLINLKFGDSERKKLENHLLHQRKMIEEVILTSQERIANRETPKLQENKENSVNDKCAIKNSRPKEDICENKNENNTSDSSTNTECNLDENNVKIEEIGSGDSNRTENIVRDSKNANMLSKSVQTAYNKS